MSLHNFSVAGVTIVAGGAALFAAASLAGTSSMVPVMSLLLGIILWRSSYQVDMTYYLIQEGVQLYLVATWLHKICA